MSRDGSGIPAGPADLTQAAMAAYMNAAQPDTQPSEDDTRPLRILYSGRLRTRKAVAVEALLGAIEQSHIKAGRNVP